jgi:rhodanese-related sulfurtransferase/DNA-binding transcriptional ArsR family regulator
MTAKRQFKDRLYAQFARIGKALASAHRLELLELLAQGPRTVESLAAEVAQSVANTSRHLQVLRGAGLVDGRKAGLYVHYRLAHPEVFRVCLELRRVAEAHLAEVDRVVAGFFGQRDEYEPVKSAELLRRLRSGEVVLLDVRPAGEFAAGHIAGAESVPITELKQRLRRLPRGQDYVAYCRGPYCVYADAAVAMLRAAGRTATRLDGGYPEWRAAGLPVVEPAMHAGRGA